MKTKSSLYDFTLSNRDIDEISETVDIYLAENRVKREDRLRLRLSMENALLSWQEQFGVDMPVTLDLFRRFGKEYIRLRCTAAEYDPFKTDTEAIGPWASSLRSTMEAAPTFDYIRGINTVCFTASKPKLSRLLVILGFLAIGVLIGLAGFILFPYSLRESICETVITPIYETYLTLFSFCGIPLIFLSVLTGILGVGDIHSFSLIGRRMVRQYALFVLIFAFITMFIAVLVFPLDFGGSAVDVQYGDFLTMILSWIPSGLFQPFINSDAMQLIIMAIAFGIGLLVLDGVTGHLEGTLNDLNSLLLRISRWMSALIPLFVFITIINSIWMSEVGVLLAAWKSWVATTAMQTVAILALLIHVSRRWKVGLGLLLRKISKVFLIALGTNSCSASINDNYDCCADRLGVDARVYVFGIPIGTSTFKPATAIRLIFLCMFMVTSEGISVSPGWLLMLFFMSLVLSVATPAIPGGTLMLCSMLFTQLGIPTAVLSQMLTTDVFFDCICTAFNQIAVSLALTSYAGNIGMLDTDVLQKELPKKK